MHVGIVTEYARPWPGGIPEHVHHEATELRRLGHDVTVITGRDRRAPTHEPGVVRLGHAIEFTGNGARSRMAVGDFVWRMRGLLEPLALDVLHVHAPLDPCLPLAAAAASHVPVVGTFHASFDRSPLFDTLYRRNPVARRAFDRLAARIVVSAEAQRSIAQYFDAAYVEIPNGVDTRRFAPGRGERARPTPQVLFVGRPDPRKGLPLLLQAHELLRRRGIPHELVLAGVTRAELGAWQPTLAAATRIYALGYVEPEKLPALYRDADVVCSPATIGESQGVVLLEAMASGRACVCFDIPGYREVVQHGQSGLLVADRTADALASALQRLLQDARLRDTLGGNGRIRAERYAWSSVAARIEAVLARATETDRRRPGYAVRAEAAVGPRHVT